MIKQSSAIVLILIMTGCSGIVPKPPAKNVQVHMDELPEEQCTYIGKVVGTYGNIFTSFLISNKVLIESAMSDMQNQAYDQGGNRVYLSKNQFNFASSVTLMGRIYRCP